jgi:hypothetical protein
VGHPGKISMRSTSSISVPSSPCSCSCSNHMPQSTSSMMVASLPRGGCQESLLIYLGSFTPQHYLAAVSSCSKRIQGWWMTLTVNTHPSGLRSLRKYDIA